MNNFALKNEIFALVSKVEDEKILSTVRDILKPLDNSSFVFSDEEIQEFDNRMKERHDGIGKSFTLEEAEAYFKKKQ